MPTRYLNCRRLSLVATFGVSALLAQGPTTAPPPAKTVAIRAATLVDPRSGTTISNAVIIIEGDTVKAVGSNLAVPAGAELIDLKGGPEPIKRAIGAGAASVEHASLIDDEGIALAKQQGTYVVMDVYNDDYILAEFARMGYPEKIIEKERQIGLTQRQNFQKAWRAGVKMAFGSDAGVYPHGWNAKQFAHMVKWA